MDLKINSKVICLNKIDMKYNEIHTDVTSPDRILFNSPTKALIEDNYSVFGVKWVQLFQIFYLFSSFIRPCAVLIEKSGFRFFPLA